MRSPVVLASVLLSALALSGCVSDVPRSRYAGDDIGLIQPSYRNPVVSRGSPDFCDSYADQTARNSYENVYDNEDGLGVDLLNQNRARHSGDRAYARCRRGRLN